MTNILPAMRRNLSASDAKAQLAAALRRAEGGDVVLITRYGKPAAPRPRELAGFCG